VHVLQPDAVVEAAAQTNLGAAAVASFLAGRFD
jgi:hypothetical protein